MSAAASAPAASEERPGTAPAAPPSRIRRRTANLSVADIGLWGIAGIAVIFLLLPIFFALISAFGVNRFPTFPPDGLTLKWFTTIDSSYVAAAKTSLTLGLVTAAISTLLGVPAGIALARWHGRGAAFVSALVRSPMQLPYIVIGVASLQFYILVARELDITLLGTIGGIALVHAVIATPYMVGAVAPAATGLSRDLELAAYGLGASRIRTFFTVTLPALRSAIFAGAVFSFLISFDDIPVTLFLVGSERQTLPVKLFFGAEFSFTPQLFAVAATVTVITSVVLLALTRVLGLKRISGV
jgi:putative spermidine/putrescine transport system permease protein